MRATVGRREEEQILTQEQRADGEWKEKLAQYQTGLARFVRGKGRKKYLKRALLLFAVLRRWIIIDARTWILSSGLTQCFALELFHHVVFTYLLSSRVSFLENWVWALVTAG